jgi:hypothetical protein
MLTEFRAYVPKSDTNTGGPVAAEQGTVLEGVLPPVGVASEQVPIMFNYVN